MKKRIRKSRLNWLYVLIFLFGFSMALLLYIMSAFFTAFIDVKYVGVIFTISYLLSFFVLGHFRPTVNVFGLRKGLIALSAVTIFSLFILGFTRYTWMIIGAFLLYMLAILLIRVFLDVVVEYYSTNKETGRIRGIYMTCYSLGIFCGPFLAGYLLDRFGFSFMFFLSALFTLPVLFSFSINFKDMDAVHFRTLAHKQHFFSLFTLKRYINIKYIFICYFFLNVFYSIMVVYTPLHLLSLGYTWTDIGLLFTIALLPFLLIQYIAGYLADHYWGEVEMLILGFFLMGLSTMALFFVQSFVLWAVLLFMTRVGAALIEILSDSYFYKQVNANDISLISLFRRSIPLGYAVGPILASFLLLFYPVPFVFLFLGFFILLGAITPYHLKDTK